MYSDIYDTKSYTMFDTAGSHSGVCKAAGVSAAQYVCVPGACQTLFTGFTVNC